MVYYTFSWVFADIGGNMYINFFLSAIVEAPMHLIAIIAMQKWVKLSVFSRSCLVFCLDYILADETPMYWYSDYWLLSIEENWRGIITEIIIMKIEEE